MIVFCRKKEKLLR